MREGQPMRLPGMRNIKRIGDEGSLAWAVTIVRRSQKRSYRKTFTDSSYADEEASLAAAQAWRDEMEALHPTLTRKDLLARSTRNTSSGRTGVYRIVSTSRCRDGSKRSEAAWIAMTPTWVTPRRQKSFSVTKYGEKEAYQLAVAAREAFEAEAEKVAGKTLIVKEKLRHPPEMRCICRIERNQHKAWHVAVVRSEPQRTYGKTFSDSQHGGKEPALAAAQAWRDEIERQHPKLTKKQLANGLSKHNTSGKSGVFRTGYVRRRADGSEYVADYWVATTPTGMKPRRTRLFSADKNGEQEAYRMAVEARLAFEALLGDSV